jgi:hypothetical protein
MSAIFDLKSLSDLIHEFVEKVPRILEKDPLTADLAPRVDRLVDFSENPFTLAVMGQMRSGKSTLINALIGEDLAPVGVNETTATINYFKFGDDQLKDIFRVHWKDKPCEDFSHSEINKWVGESAYALNTKFIEFFSNTDFFKKIYIVDTPGTRSVIESHELKIDDFLAEKRERETLQCGGRADAILYVMGPVARVTDTALLDRFESTTRQIGSSPFNSMAVVHKWETLDENDPISAAKDKAMLIADQLKGYVSSVIPVSGPFSRVSNKHSKEFWNRLAKFFFTISKDKKLMRNLEVGREDRFKGSSREGATLLEKSELPWACYKTLWKIAKKSDYPDGPTLHNIIQKASGIDKLSKLLKERFIDRTRLIKSFILLNKAMQACDTAKNRLNNQISIQETQNRRIETSLALLKRAIDRGVDYVSPAYDNLVELGKPLQTSMRLSKQIKENIESKSREVKENYDDLNKDIIALSYIDKNGFELGDQETLELRSILGCYGYSLKERIACYGKTGEPALDQVEDRIMYWSEAIVRSLGVQKQVYDQVVNRLETIAHFLENQRDNR